MPSACTKPEKKVSIETETPIKQCLTVVEKKVRNLEKRKGKLDSIREKAAAGTTLNSDQKEAVNRYDSVVQTLEFARELQKQFCAIQVEAEKLQKKQLKRESHERQQVEIRRIKELLSLQSLLDSMGADDVRADFVGGNKGAIKLTEEELDKLDGLYKLISPTRDEENNYCKQLSTASEHIVNFLDAREKEVIGTTYKQLKTIVGKINECGYFEAKVTETEEAEETEQQEEEESSSPVEEDTQDKTDAAEAVNEEENELKAESQEQTFAAEAADFSLQQTQLQDTLQQQQNTLDFTSDAMATANMLGQQQQAQTYDDDTTATVPDDTFFSTQPFMQPRPFNEIVSSVQGNFDFLQESEIEQGKAAAAAASLDSGVVGAGQIAANPPQVSAADLSSFLSESAAAAAGVTQFHHKPQESTGLEQYSGSSDLSQQAVSNAVVSSSSSSAAAASAGSVAFSSETTADLYTAAPSMGGAAGFENTEGGPAPIPMPPGQQYAPTEQDQSSAAAAQTAHDRTGASNRGQFAMNPNADIFTLPTYSSGDPQTGSFQGAGAGAAGATDRSSQPGQQQQQQQAWSSSTSSSAAAATDFSQAASNTSQQQGAYGQYSRQQRGGNQAPSYRGNNQQQRNGGAGNVNGYRGNNPRSSAGQRGGRGNYNGGPPNRGGGAGGMQQPMRGSGGAYKSYPPRSDYQAEAGGYQAYSAASAGSFMQQGPRGGPRNSMPRNSRSNNYANRMAPPQ